MGGGAGIAFIAPREDATTMTGKDATASFSDGLSSSFSHAFENGDAALDLRSDSVFGSAPSATVTEVINASVTIHADGDAPSKPAFVVNDVGVTALVPEESGLEVRCEGAFVAFDHSASVAADAADSDATDAGRNCNPTALLAHGLPTNVVTLADLERSTSNAVDLTDLGGCEGVTGGGALCNVVTLTDLADVAKSSTVTEVSPVVEDIMRRASGTVVVTLADLEPAAAVERDEAGIVPITEGSKKVQEPVEETPILTLKLAPIVPADEWITFPPSEDEAESAMTDLPKFSVKERAQHAALLVRMVARRATQQSMDTLAQLQRRWRASRLRSALPLPEKGLAPEVKPLGCVCTNQTCGTYFRLENEAAELVMLRGVSKVAGAVDLAGWTAKYTGPGQCPWPVLDDVAEGAMAKLGLPPSPHCNVRLISSYQEHLDTVKAMIMGATQTVNVMSCYFFPWEKTFMEVIEKLLPAAAHRGVRVRLLLDALPVQSALVKANLWGGLTPYVQEAKMRLLMKEFYEKKLPAIAAACPKGSFKVRFFRAMDAKEGYPIKSHMKMIGVDGRLAVTGGSNTLPTAATGKNDCDVLVSGEAAKALDLKFQEVWLEQTGEVLTQANLTPLSSASEETAEAAAAAIAVAAAADGQTIELAPRGDSSPRSVLDAPVAPQEALHPLETSGKIAWHGEGVRFVVTMSRPGHSGEDAILRSVIGLVDSAKEEFRMCMGFSGLHAPLVAALARAARRGVRVQIILNSHFSCDLRPPMRDLVAGARALLIAAPEAEVYLTGPRESWDVREEEASGEVPPFQPKYPVANHNESVPPYSHPFTFIHGKYCVADRRRCSVGSWNAWARSAFHEAEMNCFVDSPGLGEALASKWAEASRLHTARVLDTDSLAPGAGAYSPVGCRLCRPFGKFCEHAVVMAKEGKLEGMERP